MSNQIILKRLDIVQRHIGHVMEACDLLGRRLIEIGQCNLGLQLIANSYIHDNSKFRGIEFSGMTLPESKELLKISIQNHQLTNPHHVQYWGSVHLMPDVYIAELVCDLYARSHEFGTNLQDYIDTDFKKKNKLTVRSNIYKKIRYFVELLLDKPFEPIK